MCGIAAEAGQVFRVEQNVTNGHILPYSNACCVFMSKSLVHCFLMQRLL